MTKEEYWKKYDSYILCTKYHNEVNEWWDGDRFDWNYSWALAEVCSEHFDIWWNPVKFKWEEGSLALAYDCSDHFETWFNVTKFNWKYANVLVTYCKEKTITPNQYKKLKKLKKLLNARKFLKMCILCSCKVGQFGLID